MALEYTPIVVPVSLSTSDKVVVPMTMSHSDQSVDMTPATVINAITNYERLTNKPSINNVELFGNKTAYELGLAYKIKYDTTANWNANPDFIPMEGEVIIYMDKETVDGVNIPGIKVGDGLAYLIDLPFVGDDLRNAYLSHITDTVVHITEDERAFWNSKVRCYLDNETVVFTVH